MKRRSRIKRSSARKSTRHAAKHNFHSSFVLPFTFRRIILITTCIALFIVGFAIINEKGRQVVAGISITKGLFAQATIDMPTVEGAVSYNIWYKQKNEGVYKNAVREIPPSVDLYTIGYLTKDAEYSYKITAVNASGAEFWSSDENPLENLQPM